MTGCHVPMLSFLEQAARMIPNLAGIKYTHEDFMDFLSCIHFENGRYDMLWGRDENLLSALVLGARGGVGSTYNYAAPLYLNLIRAFDDGNLNEARKLQQLSIDMIRLLGKSTDSGHLGYDLALLAFPVSLAVILMLATLKPKVADKARD